MKLYITGVPMNKLGNLLITKNITIHRTLKQMLGGATGTVISTVNIQYAYCYIGLVQHCN